MLAGVIKETFLCCEGDNSTLNSVIDTDGGILQGEAPLLQILYKIVIPVILSTGILGNILIVIVLSTPLFRAISYLYLSGLALAHIGVLVSWIPLSVRLGYGMMNSYPSVFYYAHMELVAVNTFTTASTLIMTCLIVDRYISVFFPARIRSGNTRKNVHSFILSSFILGFAISAPLTGMRMVHQQSNGAHISFALHINGNVTRNVFWMTYIWIMEITLRICPTIIVMLLNALIVKKFLELNAKKKQFQSVSDKFRTANVTDTSLLTRNRGYREEQHLAVLTTVMGVCFFVTMISSMLLSILYQNYEIKNAGYQLAHAFSAVIELSNFAVHIIIYLTCSKEFRRELFKILQGRCRRDVDDDSDPPVGENEDFSRHGTTVRLTPEHTRLNSPGSPNKLHTMEEDRESELLNAADVV